MTGRAPAHFSRIRLELAREPGRPQGDHNTGYTIIAPLTVTGYLDPEEARAHRERCRVTRFRDGRIEEERQLRRRPGGSWAFHFEADGREDDDAGYRLGEHKFAVGEYVTILEDEGAHTYRVATVERL